MGSSRTENRNDVDGSPPQTAEARAGRDLARHILDHLPISLTVQDASGAPVLVNAAAALALGLPPRRLADTLPSESSTASQVAVEPGDITVGEEKIGGPVGDRTLLTSQRKLRVANESYLLSTSLDITERKRVEEQLVRRAYFDELTGLPNRNTVAQHVERVLARKVEGERFALVFIDVDNFKHINDYYSHAIGDALLAEVAHRVSALMRDSDVLARISGDEFLMIVDPIGTDTELRFVVEDCRRLLRRPFYIQGFEVLTSASIGVSIYPEHGNRFEVLQRNAGSAMSRAKTTAKGEITFFDLDLGRSVAEHTEMEQQLRLAIRDRRFSCAFQPKVDLRTREVVGFETLIRWRDDHGVLHSPNAFIGLAVELGLIDPITHFVLEESAKVIGRFDETFGHETTISINVAAKQAGNPDFMSSFIDKLKNTGRADRFMLELTEDAFISESRFQKDFLPALRALGARVSIDDFGTGYSSLSVLSEITADELKIDRSFISNIHERPRSQSVLRTIESLGRSLGMSVVAEGVETIEELLYLQTATHIRYAQGYYFSKPFYLDDFVKTGRIDGDSRILQTPRESEAGRTPNATRTLHYPIRQRGR